MATTAVDVDLFKQVMRHFATGVMVLTVADGEGMHAVTVNGLTSLSLSPLLMLVCIEHNAYSHGLLRETKSFALNILGSDQAEWGQRFAFDREARGRPMELVEGHRGQTGAWIFDHTLGFLECRVSAEYPGGDHTIFVGEVLTAGVGETEAGPLLYYDRQFISLPDV